MKVTIRLSEAGGKDKEYITLELDRIPNIGECISLGEKRIYKVLMVITRTNSKDKAPYEIFATKIDTAEQMLKAL